MKRVIVGACIALVVSLTVSPVLAQRGASGGGDSGRAVSASAPSAPSTPAPTANTSTASSSYSGSSYSGYSGGDRAFSSTPGYAPRIQGTSFTTVDAYYSWQNYYNYLYSYYRIYPTYFTRFYRNREPLVTPSMLKIALHRPLMLSSQMLKAIDELETMLSDARAGKAVDKKDLIAKSKEIRLYAKMIRQDPTLSIADLRKESDVFTEDSVNALSPEVIAKLREMAIDLNRQLTNMYSQSSTSTISVDSYKEHSFESVSKGIEKACKAIERSKTI
jgi:hypothetical protein